VAGMLGATGLRVGWASLKQLTDTQDVELIDSVANAVKEYTLEADVLSVHDIRGRYLGSRAWVDFEVEVGRSRRSE